MPSLGDTLIWVKPPKLRRYAQMLVAIQQMGGCEQMPLNLLYILRL
jgi:hypothetical protein